MSTVKATNFQHPSAGSPAIVLDADGNATVAGMGLVHINTTAFSAVSSVSVNDCFTSTFDVYLIVVTGISSPAATAANIRMRVGGSDATGASYSRERLLGSGATASSSTDASATSLTAGVIFDTLSGINQIQISNPAITTNTSFLITGGRTGSASITGGVHALATAYDGFSLIPASGTITGSVRVYGYNNG